MIEILHEGGRLHLASDTKISIEENSKGRDSNIFSFDDTQSITIPYSDENINAFQKYGFEKFKVRLFSDGVFHGEFYATFKEDKINLNTLSGSYLVDIKSPYADLSDTLSDFNIKKAIDKEWALDFSGETVEPSTSIDPEIIQTKAHKWFQTYQSSGSSAYPFRFPEYYLCKEYGFTEPAWEDTTEIYFGNWVAVNHLNDQYPTSNIGDKRVAFNVLFDRYHSPITKKTPEALTVNKTVTYRVLTTSGTKTFRNDILPRRIWGLVCPCFRYVDIIQWVLEGLGYRGLFDYQNSNQRDMVEAMYILNNYNIFNCDIERAEGQLEYTDFATSMLSEEPWVGNSPTWHNHWRPFLIGAEAVTVQAKNHIPDVTALELIEDFLIKTNFQVRIVGVDIQFYFPTVSKSDVEVENNPNIIKQKSEYLSNTVLKYDYSDKDIKDNIPDFTIDADQKTTNEIISILLPVYVHRGTVATAFPFIISEPAIDKTLCKAVMKYFRYYISSSVGGLTGPMFAPDEDRSVLYSEATCPKACGIRREKAEYSPDILKGMYMWNVNLEEIIEETHSNLRTLRWEGEDGIFAKQYLPIIDILKGKFIYFVKSKFHPESFFKFDHYRFYNILGKKGYPFKRKYTLPLSINPDIDLELYEVD